ncbi:MAG: hypothetical protein OEZ39_17385 [Gammaproteobacteria bacterium]|nr:hypothetical protein [Gammaproteobacteria bacterium]MDH5653637.1 hypothetical protein [Gammaproteobacteria bacterium]
MAGETYRIMFGAAGWRHAAWQTIFYPDDLPEEWQLGYYGNEFPVVLFPADYWSLADESIAEWLSDCGDALQFVCEFSSPAQFQDQAGRLALFSGRCCGVICRLSPDEMTAGLPDSLPETEVPLSVDTAGQPVSPEATQLLQARGISLVRYDVAADIPVAQGRFVCTRVNSETTDMRALRRIIESLLSQTSARQTVVIIFDGTPPRIDVMRNAVVLLDLID